MAFRALALLLIRRAREMIETSDELADGADALVAVGEDIGEKRLGIFARERLGLLSRDLIEA